MVSVSGFRSLGILLRLPNIYVAQTSPSSSSLISCRRSLSCSCASWKTYNSIADTDQVIHLSVNNFKKTPMTFEELKVQHFLVFSNDFTELIITDK